MTFKFILDACDLKEAGSYNVTVSSSNGCSEASIPVTVTVMPLPSAMVLINGSTILCPEDSVQLIAGTAKSYAWNSGATTQSIIVTTPGSYVVTVTGDNGCRAVSEEIAIELLAPSDGDAIGSLGDSLYSPYGAPNYWYLAGSINPIDTGDVVSCDLQGGYIVSGIDEQGCHAYSDTLAVNCVMSAVDDYGAGSRIFVFPNPAFESLHLSGTNVVNGEYHYSLINLIGQTRLSGSYLVLENSLE